MKQKRAYHYRFYPTDEQAHLLEIYLRCGLG
ncbi:MAG: helix-turn-helix domain-containing protein [Ktedonobacteraceae bacterium]